MFNYAFWGLCHGTFVEVGGADGISNSNTYAAEMDMGWRGVLTEVKVGLIQEEGSREISIRLKMLQMKNYFYCT